MADQGPRGLFITDRNCLPCPPDLFAKGDKQKPSKDNAEEYLNFALLPRCSLFIGIPGAPLPCSPDVLGRQIPEFLSLTGIVVRITFGAVFCQERVVFKRREGKKIRFTPTTQILPIIPTMLSHWGLSAARQHSPLPRRARKAAVFLDGVLGRDYFGASRCVWHRSLVPKLAEDPLKKDLSSWPSG